MDNSTQIKQLIKNRKLSSEEEFKLFEDALHKLQGNKFVMLFVMIAKMMKLCLGLYTLLSN